ncbi:ATP-binding cassette domain-containing protein [candidate division NPL-UPA2 bacterium]|nr:ATP-binding cassette domain-containing protein [candidate division NPL-UPA2 bacterium]
MIEVRNLTKYYGGALGIEDVSFTVERGETVGLLGPNAAGKTTTMRILTCFLPATSGVATVSGHDVFTESLEVRKRIGYLPENVPLYNDMRVNEYLSYRAKLKEIPRSQRKKRLNYVLERCRIGDVQNRIIGQLSRGYRQRVGFASSLIHDPEILILDEPTIGLDPNQIRETRKLIKELGGDHTILLSSHILPEVEMVCGRVIIINKGRVSAMDTPDGLIKRLRGGAVISIEVRGPGKVIYESLTSIPGVSKVTWHDKGEISRYSVEMKKGEDVREEVSRCITRGGGIIREMKEEAVSLEDIFVQITMEEK